MLQNSLHVKSFAFNTGSVSPTCILTGASTGIGRTLAIILAREGYDLALVSRRETLLSEIRQDILQKFPHRKVLVCPLDVADEQTSYHTIKKLAEQLGGLDLFIANAGIGYRTPAWKPNWQDVRAILQTNLLGTIACLEAAKEVMLAQKRGHLVGISSVAAFRGLPASAGYCTSKAGLAIYLESLRLDLKYRNIAVSSIHPGYVATPMTAKNKFPMPFLLPAEPACEKIWRAIHQRKARYVFPWQMQLFVWLMQFVPDRIFDYFVARTNKNGIFDG